MLQWRVSARFGKAEARKGLVAKATKKTKRRDILGKKGWGNGSARNE